VPKENQPKPKPENAPRGFDKFKEAAQNLPGTKVSSQGQNEPPVAPDIAESSAQMAGEDISVEDIPFN
jgi:hypothetical protein